jgi:hypothetical protein
MASDAAVDLARELGLACSLCRQVPLANCDVCAGTGLLPHSVDLIRAALAAARAEERERAAVECERVASRTGFGFSDIGAEECAAAIRALTP